jgi:hypothetical protein
MAAAAQIVILLLKLAALALGAYRETQKDPEILLYDGRGPNAGAVNRANRLWRERLRQVQANRAARPGAGGDAATDGSR